MNGSDIKLHLGCGKRYLPGFLHVDAIRYDHLDYVGDISKLYFIESNTVSEIYASHVLEHFKRADLPIVLAEWKRVLKPNGLLRLSVPNFAAIVDQYRESNSLEGLQGLLYGGQTYEYNFHHIAFDFKHISEILNNNGFINIVHYDWRKFLPAGFDDYSRAYIPHMDESGRLMSLNLIAHKK